MNEIYVCVLVFVFGLHLWHPLSSPIKKQGGSNECDGSQLMISRDGRIGGGGLGGSSDPLASPGVGHPAEARVDRAALGFVDFFPLRAGGFSNGLVSTGLASQKKLSTKNAG